MKIQHIIESSQARLYTLPKDTNDLYTQLIYKRNDNSDAVKVYERTLHKLMTYSEDLSEYDPSIGTTFFNDIKGKLLFVKNVLENLNTCKTTSHFVEGRFWLPESVFDEMQGTLNDLSKREEFQGFRVMRETVDINIYDPPTKFKTSIFLSAKGSLIY